MRTPVVTAWVFFVAAVSSVVLAASRACSPDLEVSWVVNNSATASDLARAANCSGGAFDVEWIGHVDFPETIYVIDDTVMNITGAGAGAVADGANSKQFLIVINATLRVSGLRIQSCTALNSGGAIWAEASVLTFNETVWTQNTAGEHGGAVFVSNSSGVSWSGETTWSNNTAGEIGGAVAVCNSSSVSWTGNMAWSYNSGKFSGAVVVWGSSDVSWTGNMAWSHNNAEFSGGAVMVSGSSDVSWSGDTTWSNNTTGEFGGAVVVEISSNVSWTGETTWSHNAAGEDGGAVLVLESSNVCWSGEMTWSHNTVGEGGGAVIVWDSSEVSWSGETAFCNNTAGDDGGAVYVGGESSEVSWSGETTFFNNAVGESGGAVFVFESSSVSWSGNTAWSQNNAGFSGGAVSVWDSSAVSWSGETTFSNNNASDGGAVYVVVGSEVSWSGETMWYHNTAGINGGAIFAFSSTVSVFNQSLFEGNTAGDVGGAIMLSGVEVGPAFVRTNFIANTSPRGGAVSSVSSGIATDDFGDLLFPVVYKDCLFKDNRASVSGGAIESVAGYDHAVNTVFEGNTAGVGGALRLSGSAILTNCVFVDNSAEDQGPAISNLGVLGVEGNASRFSGNLFACENGMYLDTVIGNRYQTVCDKCPENSDWIEFMENEDKVPICVEKLEHTRSDGGDTTIETLDLDPGYWRATNASVDVRACFNNDACKGGMTDDPAFCQLGYEGAYCSVCSEGYSVSMAFTCTKCVDDRGIAILVTVGVFVLGAAFALFMHLVSEEMGGTCRSAVYCFTKRLPRQSIKIIVVVYQILTQFASIANVTYPEVYQLVLDRVSIFNLDALGISSAGCIVEVDFHGRLLVSTIGPLVVLTLLAITWTVARSRCESEAARQKVGQKHMSLLLLISFLVYSPVSSTVFKTFACEDLDDGKEYLRADYRIECDSSKHQGFQVLASIMILVYPVGIPLVYAYLLFKNRSMLRKSERTTSTEVQRFADLWAPYKPKRFYYEVIECLRRTSLTGVVVFIYPNTAAQVAVTWFIAFFFVVMSLLMAPYDSNWDTGISLTGHVIVILSMYLALLSKVDVSDERAISQETFAGILVAANACMVVAVVVETIVIFCRSNVLRVGPR